uniref:PsbP C-terminal domain-containing protein n=1 Tax=Chromera velia CCMP2878 TaxID=1169474 RepID=A0A0G4GI95_9ALVE|mmetsp:Transcript_49736/g.98004  ORF Transcript_49736/g.98004 Transcript_49736/m.98004 type:complete len:301 (-) Transcript_49736:288-1190(-)|eukprot:Cvel_22018.t1-p1 / transcript=Cvel_22018.t1 / gene=Cvel_22018 / organism=Chromera_velia_CCMP2878 / gene_product=hypothetical protein / transcript_product=hypothetical protein / location=Cvel_scaffold2124:1441-4665(-) / protein_length=300 / sequence_SO=supercontig / SO=protein_coding / is_pseudo=false
MLGKPASQLACLLVVLACCCVRLGSGFLSGVHRGFSERSVRLAYQRQRAASLASQLGVSGDGTEMWEEEELGEREQRTFPLASRRAQGVQALAALAALALASSPASAVEYEKLGGSTEKSGIKYEKLESTKEKTTTFSNKVLGGALSPYKSSEKGFKVSRPAGWVEQNCGDEGTGEDCRTEYLVRWRDLIEQTEQVKVSAKDITKKDIDEIGTVEAVAEKLAKNRKAKVVEVERRRVRGQNGTYTLFDIHLLRGDLHNFVTLGIWGEKVWELNAICLQSRLSFREETYREIQKSFGPVAA